MEIQGITPKSTHLASFDNPPDILSTAGNAAAIDTTETFQKSPRHAGQVMAHAGRTARELFSQNLNPVTESWTFKATSPCLLRTVYTPLGTLICQDQGWLYSLNGSTGEKEWELVKRRSGMSSPAVAPDGTVFLDEIYPDRILAVDGTTGKEKWSVEIARGKSLSHLDMMASNAHGSLFTSGLFSDEKGMHRSVSCLDSSSGSIMWEKHFPSSLVSTTQLSADESSLLVNLSGRAACLDPKTGTQKWAFKTAGVAGTVTPALGPQGNVYFRGKDDKLHALDGSNGKPLWEFPLEGGMWGIPDISPDGTLYLPTTDKIVALDGSRGTVKWEFQEKGRYLQPLGIDKSGRLHMYDERRKELLIFEGDTGELKEKLSLQKNWMMAELSPDGHIYFVDGHNVKALKVGITREMAEELQKRSREEGEPQHTEEVDGYVMIGGVRLPIQGDNAGGRNFYVLGAFR